MTQEQGIEGNKLIAEFVGFKMWWSEGGSYDWPEKELEISVPDFLEDEDLEYMYTLDMPFYMYWGELKFNTSWDWLMPVVEKIEELGYTTVIHGYGKDFTPYLETYCAIKEGNYRWGYGESKSKIEAVWLASVLFIQWYNEQKH